MYEIKHNYGLIENAVQRFAVMDETSTRKRWKHTFSMRHIISIHAKLTTLARMKQGKLIHKVYVEEKCANTIFECIHALIKRLPVGWLYL